MNKIDELKESGFLAKEGEPVAHEEKHSYDEWERLADSLSTENPKEMQHMSLKDLEPMKADMYILKIPENLSNDEITNIKRGFDRLIKRSNIEAPIMMLPSNFEFIGTNEVDFSIALHLVKKGYKMCRGNVPGYIHMQAGFICWSADSSVWKPSQVDIQANNWNIYKESSEADTLL